MKLIHLTKIPEDWDSGFALNLYHDGFTFSVQPDTKLASDMITYDECDFLKSIEAGLIPETLIPILDQMNMLSENKVVVSISDYRGFPRQTTTHPYILDYPIIKRHVLTRSVQSLVLELYDSVGEKLSLSQIQTLENYLVMLNSPPLCLDTSSQVFEIKCGIHHNQNMLNEPAIRQLISKSTRSDNISTAPDLLRQLCEIIQPHSKDIYSSKESSVDSMLKKSNIPAEYTAPNMLNDILELCVKRARSARLINEQATMRHINAPRSVENHQISDQIPSHPEVSPSGYSTPAPPQLKPAPSYITNITNSKNPGAGVVMTPISPNIQGGLLGNTSVAMVTTAQTSPHTPVPQSGMTPGQTGPQPPTMSPKNVAAVSRMPSEAIAMGKAVRGTYSPGYLVPQQQQQQLNKGQLPAQGMVQAPSQQGLIRAPGGPIMGNMHIPHIPVQSTQHIPVQSTQGHIVQKPLNTDGTPQMNKPMQNTGMMIPQQYQRNYYNVQTRGFVEQAQYIPVQQARPGQVLQISLPPNMNPHQSRPRQQGMSGITSQQQQQQQPIHRMPYNQIQMGGIQNPNMYNQYG